MKRTLLVGLTGGIGSGKSIIAKVFESLGVPVFNADEIATHIISNDVEAIKQVTAGFGLIYSNGVLDKVKMASLVFKNDKALQKLNQIIHPKVALYFDKWVTENKTAPILIKEAAILIESGAYLQMDRIILVTSPKPIRIQRVMKRNNVAEQQVKERIQHQLSDEEKMTYSDFILVNDDKQLIIPQVLEVYEHLLNL